jgi:Spy/CpxP family protein refolding chaperone
MARFGYNLGAEALVPSACRERGALQRANVRKIVTGQRARRSSSGEAKDDFAKIKMKHTMKRNILAFVAAGAIALGGFVVVQAQAGPGGGGRGHGFGLQGITKQLNLTSDQQTKVQPILDAAKPQLAAIHQEAMQKAKGVIDSSLSQIRSTLTADQQKKLDSIQKAHQDMMNAHKELHDAMQQ